MKNGILIIDKPKGITSRDVVNEVCKKLNTKKVGHTGTLDPLATGVLIICVNEATKVIELLTSDDKSYLAEVEVGKLTDTLDITGNILDEVKDIEVDNKKLKKILSSFVGEYLQEVPLYSAVKVNGRRLYDYARKNEKVELPKRLVKIKEISLVEEYNSNSNSFKFLVSVSKGTYIRSLIRDIGDKYHVLMTMKNLKRIKQGSFTIDNAISLEEISYDKVIKISDCLSNIKKEIVDEKLSFKIKNGVKLNKISDDDFVMFLDSDNTLLAIYQKDDKDFTKIKPYCVFRSDE